jgi:hypothetical protein
MNRSFFQCGVPDVRRSLVIYTFENFKLELFRPILSPGLLKILVRMCALLEREPYHILDSVQVWPLSNPDFARTLAADEINAADYLAFLVRRDCGFPFLASHQAASFIQFPRRPESPDFRKAAKRH